MTATLPPELFAWADRLRQAHFPPERNHLAAHVTLFHALPPTAEREVKELLSRLCAEYPPPKGRVTGLLDLGGGTAIQLASPDLMAMRDMMAEQCHGLLSAQDRHRPRLHVTIQNKVAPQVARALQSALATTVSERTFRFAGLALHRYRGGPWEPAGQWSFRGRESAKRGG